MRELSDMLLFVGAIFVPVIASILIIELLLRGKGLGTFSSWLTRRWKEFEIWRAPRLESHMRFGGSSGFSRPLAPSKVAQGADPAAAHDAQVLFLHEVEMGTNRALLVSFKNEVYVSPRHHRQIDRYLRQGGWTSALAAFEQHGYRLFTSKSR